MSSESGKKHRERKSESRYRGRVFIIGAGVSASCGIAVANRILRESVMRMEHVDFEKTDRIHDLLRYLYPNFDRHLRNYPNIEDFLNLLEMAKRFNTEEFITSDRWSETKLDEVKRITLKAVTDYIWDRIGVLVFRIAFAFGGPNAFEVRLEGASPEVGPEVDAVSNP